MKTTKVLGLVLGALLVAALFTGAAAATDNEKYLGDAYAWVQYADNAFKAEGIAELQGTTWTDAFGNTVTFLPEGDGADVYISGNDVVAEGDYTYTNGVTKFHLNVKCPTAAVAGSVYGYNTTSQTATKVVSALIGSTVMNDKFVNFTAPLDSGSFNATWVAFTNPAGTLTAVNLSNFGAVYNDDNGGWTIKGLDLGIWTAQAYFMKGEDYSSILNGEGELSQYAPDYVLGQPYYFTVISSDDAKKIEASPLEIVQGGYSTVKVTAPTGVWTVKVTDGTIPAGQPLVAASKATGYTDADGYWNITVGSEGYATFTVTTSKTSNIKVELLDQKDITKVKKSVTIKVKSGAITATSKESAVYIGNEFDVTGTNDLGGQVYFFIKGTNYKFQPVLDGDNNLSASGKEWEATIDTTDMNNGGKKPDAGTYTVFVASLNNLTSDWKVGEKDGVPGTPRLNISELDYEDMDDSFYVNAYATVTVALKQPFISITKAPEVLVQGEKLVVEGTAEGDPANVQYYIFGTNFFNFGEASVTDGTFSVEIAKEYTKKDYMAAGQYFFVVQHPMYDKDFNIGANATKIDNASAVVKKLNDADTPTKTGDIVLNKTGDFTKGDVIVLFNTLNRQSANAAQALCDALDSQDIDDMYAKASFVVAGPTSYIDPIPSQVTKGQILTISGTTTGHVNDVVSVELLSTAFAAVPKEAVGSASFVALTTKIGADGVWSISFDTSNLNADEYTCSVAVGQLDATSAKINIVDGTTPVTPTQTGSPVTPTVKPTAQPTSTPKSPGFGALAALAGLGAVAVLLLRRQ